MPCTDRLNLRSFRPSDAERLYAILSAPGVLDYFPPGPAPTPDTALKMIERILDDWRDIGFGLWAVEHSGELIGRGGLQTIAETGETEVDFIIDKGHWGSGFATEVGLAGLQYGFETLGVDRIVGIVHPDNKASMRVLEKLGMTRVERTEYFGMVVEKFSITANRWSDSIQTLD